MPDRIAVIIPCYNHAHYVGEALESVLAQTRKPDRVIVIDDGSKDNSVEVLRSFESRGVEVFARENRGAHNTLNELVGLAAKDCEFVSILNSDDRYLPGRMARCLELVAANQEKAVFSTGLQVMDGEGRLVAQDAPRSRWFHGAWSIGQQEGISLASWLGQANFIATTSNVFARTAYLQANPFRPYRFNHDYFFLSTAVLEDRLAVTPDVHVDYRVHGSNTIATKPEPLIREMIRLHLDLYRHHAVALREQAEMRRRFYDFTRSSWDSISSFHAGMFQVGLAQIAASWDEETLEKLAAELSGPEYDEFPNRSLAGAFNGGNSLASGGMLSRKVDELQAKLSQSREDKDALDGLNKLRSQILSSTWVRLGLLLGTARALAGNEGKKPAEKLARLKTACAENSWLKLGAQLGSSSARALRKGDS